MPTSVTPTVTDTAAGIALYDRWAQFWNGELHAADLMAPTFVLQYAQVGAEEINQISDADTFTDHVAAFRADRPGIHYQAEGPAVVSVDGDESYHVARPYLAVIPADAEHPEIRISGTDILRVREGRIVEVWSVSAFGKPFYG
ncbi:hypothetical protein [Gordonia sputi]